MRRDLDKEEVAERSDRCGSTLRSGIPARGPKLGFGRDVKLSHLTFLLYLGKVAERTRLELATPGVTGRYSNQLN
ncbi:hypothetical protein, partial [Reinekea sp.]|uniref:hypothetical protein n=1 Tax=Reinekea sp. TaxID=1970455 RepID=UPI003989F503